ncbi:B3 domain-containing protein At1g49475-like [Lotus japonicus]|uniref:B3 domain-containing protein At1g49475-like n=1 Tax=Lotus japonicus TaxID=34305 RepID=UPI00258C373F|nr:B3 domain-containing protein At1g49475-like [Lotus japonicus]
MEQNPFSGPEDNNNFLKPLYLDREHVVIPRRFLRAHPYVLEEQTANLTDPVGNVFQTRVMGHGNEIWFEGGFNLMRETHLIEGTVYIHFTHVQESSFNVRIFDVSQVEVDYANPIQQHQQVEDPLAWISDLTRPLCTGKQPLVI